MTYNGMSANDIINFAISFAKKYGLGIEHSEAIAFYDEAMLQVGLDIEESPEAKEISWPVTGEVDLSDLGYFYPIKVFGDATRLVYIPYDKFREMFMGGDARKPVGDTSTYYTILGKKLIVEPSVSGFSNLVMLTSPRFKKYNEMSNPDDPTEVELDMDYRILVCYKICALAYPREFENLYRYRLREKISDINRKLSIDRVIFWDPFAGSEDYRG